MSKAPHDHDQIELMQSIEPQEGNGYSDSTREPDVPLDLATATPLSRCVPISSPAGTKAHLWIALSVVIACHAAIWLAQPRIGVRDIDAYAYVLGAYSLQNTARFTWLDGKPIDAWPPGYSAILALFPEPIVAGKVINYVSLSLATLLFYVILRKCGWGFGQALSVAVFLHMGLLGHLATNLKPDVLCVALFLVATLTLKPNRWSWFLFSTCLCDALIWLKHIALAFTPAAITEIGWQDRKRLRAAIPQLLGAAMLFGLTVFSLMLYKKLTLGDIIPESHAKTDWKDYLSGLYQLSFSVFRDLLTSWYGTIKRPLPLICVLLQFGAVLVCLKELRFNHSGWTRIGRLGLFILINALILRAVRNYDLTARLVIYGLMLLLAGAGLPRQNKVYRWIACAVVSVVVFLLNSITVNQLGGNDPRYAEMAKQVALSLKRESRRPAIIYSNSFRVLDIHERIATIPISSGDEIAILPPESWFLYVRLSSFDGIASTVTPIDASSFNEGWERVAEVPGAAIYRRIALPSGAVRP